MVSSSTDKSKVYLLSISEEYAGQRLDNFLFTHLKGVPKTRIYRGIRTGEFRVNRSRISANYRLQAGDSIRIPPIQTSQEKPPLLSHDLKTLRPLLDEILYEDDGFFVLNKPVGLAVHGGSGLHFGVIEAMRKLRNEPHLELVHRLDKDTSGCLMLAKKRSALRALHESLRSGKVIKTYLALVKGSWQGGSSVNVGLKKNQLASGERIVRASAEGQSALTRFRVLKKYRGFSLMEVNPITGRTHQIRVHSQYVGNPIVGDIKYGESAFNEKLKKQGVERLFLHASQITLKLANHETPLIINAPVDREWKTGIQQLTGEAYND